MTVQVVNTAQVLARLQERLRGDLSDQTRVEVMAELNTDPGQAVGGWVSLYSLSETYTPRTLGSGGPNWSVEYSLQVVAQAVDLSSPQEAHAKLAGLLKTVLDSILNELKLSGTVDTLTGLEVQYRFIEEEGSSLHFITAFVTLSYEGRTRSA